MRFSAADEENTVTHLPPMADSQDEFLNDDGEMLTDIEAQLLEIYESMSQEDQNALTRVAQLLETSPEEEPMTKEKFEKLFFSAKSLQ